MPTTNCFPREILKQYLGGAFEEQHAIEIELHLESCTECERTIVSLDSDPDTLLDSLRATSQDAAWHRPTQDMLDCQTSGAEFPSVIARAVSAARQIPFTAFSKPSLSTTFSKIGAYDLIRPLGRGGMGMVVLARHRSLHKEVAIKLLTSLAGDRNELVMRFQREMRTSGRLNHSAIVNATDAGQEQGTHYLVMEFIDGLDLSRVARLAGPLSIPDACELVRQTAIGLSHAHAAGVVHRDIKPSNLMVDTKGCVKILDFGLAQLSNWDDAVGELTTIGQLMGTLDYMAPEQAEHSGAVNYRADLYALGATLFRLLVGRAPLAATPSMTLLDKVRMLSTETAPSLTNFRNDCPLPLVELVKQLLSRDPLQRPASAAHVSEALEPFCSGHQLVGLLTKAQAVAAHVVTEEPQQLAPSQPPSVQYVSQPKAISSPSRKWPWLLCALVPLAAWAGIVITLETQKGQLVIQSEVGDVHIQLAKDGKVINEMTVQPGAQITRLRADKYEIRIDSPSDQVGLDIDGFSIKNGETIVATIKRTEKAKQLSLEQFLGREQGAKATAVQPSTLPVLDPAEGLSSKQETVGTEPLHDGLSAPAAVSIPPNDPKEVVKLFLDAMRAGNGAKLSSFLSKLAQEEIKRTQLEIAPLGSPNAVFKIDDATKQDDDSMLVSSSWTEPEKAGQPPTDLEIIWALRREPEGWRICGMAVEPRNGSDVQIVNFEHLEQEQPSMQFPQNRTSPPINAEPSLDEWLADLERHINLALLSREEVETQLQAQALSRIAELTKSDQAPEVSNRLLTIAKKADVSLWSDVDQILTPAHGLGNRPTLDVLLLDCFGQIQTKENFQQFLESQLLTGDDRWTSRWFAVLLKLAGNDGNNRYRFSADDEFKSKLLATYGLDRYGPKSSELAFAFLLRSLLTNKSFAEKHAQSLITVANSHPSLGRTVSLSIDCRLEGKFNPHMRFTLAEGEIEVEKEVARFAKQVLLSTQSTPQELALAAGRLATTTEIVYEWSSELVEELRTRLKVLAANPLRLSALLDYRYGEFSYSPSRGLQNFPSTNIFIESKARGRAGLNTPRYIRSEAISYIALAKRLSATDKLSEELSLLMVSTSESYVRVAIRQKVEPPNPITVPNPSTPEMRARYNLLDPNSPTTWWPFEESVLKTLGSTYTKLPQSVWIQWAVFRELGNAIPNVHSPMMQWSNSAMAEVDLKMADVNEDGSISKSEIHALPELFQGRVYQDLNEDGSIDLKEIIAARYR